MQYSDSETAVLFGSHLRFESFGVLPPARFAVDVFQQDARPMGGGFLAFTHLKRLADSADGGF